MNTQDAPEDWRAFLARKIDERRARRPLSLRALAARAGFRSPGYFQRLLSGERTPSDEAAAAVAAALGLGPEDRAQLLDLVALARTLDPAERRRLEGRVHARRIASSRTELGPDQASLFRQWYTPIVWALAGTRPRGELAAWLARRLAPLVTASQVERTIDVLAAERFLTVDPAGALGRNDSVLDIVTPASSKVLTRYYLECLGAFRKLAARLPREERNLRVATFTFPETLLPEVHERVRAFHQELAAWAAAHEPDPASRIPVAAAQVSTAVLYLRERVEIVP